MDVGHYWALFASAFVSSTLLPGGSEALLIYLLSEAAVGEYPLLWLVATLGNTLGGMTSWGIGVLLMLRFPARPLRDEHRRAMERIERWGGKVLLLSWLPVIGDPLCLAAGWLRVGWAQALLYIALGKAARYGLLVVGLSPS